MRAEGAKHVATCVPAECANACASHALGLFRATHSNSCCLSRLHSAFDAALAKFDACEAGHLK